MMQRIFDGCLIAIIIVGIAAAGNAISMMLFYLSVSVGVHFEVIVFQVLSVIFSFLIGLWIFAPVDERA